MVLSSWNGRTRAGVVVIEENSRRRPLIEAFARIDWRAPHIGIEGMILGKQNPIHDAGKDRAFISFCRWSCRMSSALWTADYIRGDFNAGYEGDKCVCLFRNLGWGPASNLN